MLNLPSMLFHFIIYTLFIQHVLCARHSVKHLTDSNSFDLCNHPIRQGLMLSWVWWKNWGTERVVNFLPRVPGLVSGRVGFSPDRLVELSCCTHGNERFGPSGVFLLAHLCPGSKTTFSSLRSSGLCYSSRMHFWSGGLCLSAWSWPWQHPEARSEEWDMPPLPSFARSHQALSQPPRGRSSKTLGLLPPTNLSFPRNITRSFLGNWQGDDNRQKP